MGLDDEVIIAIAPSPFRRWVGVGCLWILGGLLILLSLSDAGGLWRLFFLVSGLVALWGGDVLRRATAEGIELTRTEVRTTGGRVLARVENVAGVERGAFALKPSNGFLVRLKTPEGRGWAPGLWWQRGKLLGVGGVIGGGETRAMADLLAALIKGQLPE